MFDRWTYGENEGAFGPQIPQRDEAGRVAKPAKPARPKPNSLRAEFGLEAVKVSGPGLTPEGAILFPEVLVRLDGRTVRALQLRDGSICRANTPEQRDLHNWAFGRLCRVMEDYCTSSQRTAEVVQAAEDSGFAGGSVRLAVRFYREANRLTPLQVIFELHAQDSADPIPGLAWGTGVAELDSELGELVKPWYSTTGQDLGQDRPLMDRIFAAFSSVLAKQWQRLDDHCQATGLGTVDLILQQRDARLGRKRRQPTFGGTTAESDDAI